MSLLTFSLGHEQGPRRIQAKSLSILKKIYIFQNIKPSKTTYFSHNPVSHSWNFSITNLQSTTNAQILKDVSVMIQLALLCNKHQLSAHRLVRAGLVYV